MDKVCNENPFTNLFQDFQKVSAFLSPYTRANKVDSCIFKLGANHTDWAFLSIENGHRRTHKFTVIIMV